jgi:D-amino-acid oxidase
MRVLIAAVAGGTANENQWNTQPSEQETRRIQSNTTRMFPALAGVEHRVWVGLRPARSLGVRVESELVGNTLVVHNYGHSGAGFTLALGCAEDAVKLVRAQFARPSL